MIVRDSRLPTDRAVRPPAPAGGPTERRGLTVQGVVQGVGFRPFVWRLAQTHGLAGSVRNGLEGVVIEAEGDPSAINAFVRDLEAHAPALAQVTSVTVRQLQCLGQRDFQVEASRPSGPAAQAPPPDAVVCADCRTELADPLDRRHRYPFVNCTGCGPRFTIIESLPYDRAATTMRHFPMCAECAAEYEDPGDRRFHAEPVACPRCGPRLWLTDADGEIVWGDPIDIAAAALRSGAIVAVKGIGGFQLACDATDDRVVALLRDKKRRPAKPLAVMVGDVVAARLLADVDEPAAAALSSPAGSIVLVPQRDDAPLSSGVSAGLDEVGLMLPTSPLHLLLCAEVGRPLVMTSGNISDEPICCDNDEALQRLGGIADLFLLHDREITSRYDDSVTQAGRVIRGGRGLTPAWLALPEATIPGVAFGAHLKNTFALLSEGRVLLSPHLGDLDTPLALTNAAAMLDTYISTFRVQPRLVACDLHPDYASTARAEALAQAIGVDPVRVQHHQAHIASVMAEHGLRGELVGIALDGTGLGPDGTVWGGEVLVVDERDVVRAGRIATVRQPGGDRCARDGWRMSAAYLVAAGSAAPRMPARWRETPVDGATWDAVARLSASPMSPLSSSTGRLFDAVASLLDIAHVSTYEGEAAMRLETAARRHGAAAAIPVEIAHVDGCWVADTVGLVREIAVRRAAGEEVGALAARFHASLGSTLADIALRVAEARGLERVALSGGCLQNRLLLGVLHDQLSAAGLRVFSNQRVPANDGGISAGQALVLAASAGQESAW